MGCDYVLGRLEEGQEVIFGTKYSEWPSINVGTRSGFESKAEHVQGEVILRDEASDQG